MSDTTVGRELQMADEVLRLVYRFGRDADRTDLLEKLSKKRKYRKLVGPARAFVGLALTVSREESGFIELRGRVLEATHHSMKKPPAD